MDIPSNVAEAIADVASAELRRQRASTDADSARYKAQAAIRDALGNPPSLKVVSVFNDGTIGTGWDDGWCHTWDEAVAKSQRTEA